MFDRSNITTPLFMNEEGVVRPLKYAIAFFENEQQADYASRECKENFDNKYFLDIHLKNFNPYDNRVFHQFSETSIGNLAFLALNCPFEDVVSKCFSALAAYQLFLYDFGLCVEFDRV